MGFEPRVLSQNTKWESLSLSCGRKSGKLEKKKWEVKCTAEGIERGMLMGRRGREEATAKELVPERFKVVVLLACVM